MPVHKTAGLGNVWRVKNGLVQVKTRRTGLLYIWPAPMATWEWPLSLLADRKCLVHPCNNENRTALIKAIRYQEEDWATILLDRGVGPNAVGINGNITLHCAVTGQNTAIVAKLLSYKANIEERHEDDLRPLSLAIKESEEQMVGFLLNGGTEVDQVESNDQVT